MKHRVALRKLSRSGAHRRALFRNQLTSLIEHERIETTVPKAKELRRIADRVITLGKQQTLTARRRVNAVVRTACAAKKVFVDLAPRFESTPGGYTRVLRTRLRRGDCAPMAVIEWSITPRSILTADQLVARRHRKTRSSAPRGLADALPAPNP